MEFDKVFNKLKKNNTELMIYPVGDLVNKLSNFGKDNIVHNDEIKYNKNKNLKIKQFLFDVNKKLKENVNEENQKLQNEGNNKTDHKIVNPKNEDDNLKHSLTDIKEYKDNISNQIEENAEKDLKTSKKLNDEEKITEKIIRSTEKN